MVSLPGKAISSAVCLEDLPVEILLHFVQTIFSFEDKVNFMSVSRRFYNTFVKDIYKQAGEELDWYPLMEGVKGYRVDTLQRCLEAGSPLDLRHRALNYQDREGELTPLEYAIMLSNLKSVKWLLARGASCKNPAEKHMIRYSTSLLEFAFHWQRWSPRPERESGYKEDWAKARRQFGIYRLLMEAGAPIEHRVIATLLTAGPDRARCAIFIIHLLLDYNPNHFINFSFKGIPISDVWGLAPTNICLGWRWEDQLPTLDLMLQWCEVERTRSILLSVRDEAAQRRDESRRPERMSQWREWRDCMARLSQNPVGGD